MAVVTYLSIIYKEYLKHIDFKQAYSQQNMEIIKFTVQICLAGQKRVFSLTGLGTYSITKSNYSFIL